jgi:hypothetical protein
MGKWNPQANTVGTQLYDGVGGGGLEFVPVSFIGSAIFLNS